MRLHSRHDSGRNGLLVTMLMFVFNRGQIRNDTNRRNTFKWITEEVRVSQRDAKNEPFKSVAKRRLLKRYLSLIASLLAAPSHFLLPSIQPPMQLATLNAAPVQAP